MRDEETSSVLVRANRLRRMEPPEEEVDYLKFQRTVNTLLGMPFYVSTIRKWGPRFGRVISALHRYFTEIIVIVVTMGQFWAVPYVSEDMNVLCGCLASGSHCAQVVAKTAFLNICKKQYLTHLERVHSLQKETNQFESSVFRREPFGFAKFHQQQSKYVNVIVIIQLVVNFASTSAYFLPFVYDAIVNHEEVHRQLTPIVVYLGTDFNYTPFFQAVVIVLTVGFYVNNLKTVVIDNFLLSLIILHMSQLKYHNNLLKEIMENHSKRGEREVDQDLIKGWMKQHQSLLSLCDSFRQLISPYLFLEFSYVLIHTCVPAFVITSTFSWTLPQKVAVFLMVGGGLIELFLMSNAGDVFSDAWNSTGNIVFESELIFKDGKWMKETFLMIQKRLSRPFRLTALNIVPLSCTTFMLILRLIFSYYMTLNEIQKMKRNDKEWSNYRNFVEGVD